MPPKPQQPPEKPKTEDEEQEKGKTPENPTTNSDGHNKHQDNELKNLQAQTANLRKEVENVEGEQGKKPQSMRPSTEEEVNEHKEAEKTSQHPVTDEQKKFMTIVASQTIRSLQTASESTNIGFLPLSEYKFGSVSRETGDQFSLTPYFVSADVPQMFKYVAKFNAGQQANLPDLVKMSETLEGVRDTIAESIKTFNISTMTVRIELNEKVGRSNIYDPNQVEDGTIKLALLESIGNVNPQRGVNFVESRLFSVLTAFSGLNDILVAIPKKSAVLFSCTGGEASRQLVAMPTYENLHIHPIFSVFSNIPQWARNHFDTEFKRSPVQIGEYGINSFNGTKLFQYTKLVIDQYTASVLRQNFDKIKNRTLTTQNLHNRLLASVFEFDKIRVRDLVDVVDFSMLYDYSDAEYQLAMFNILTSVQSKQEIVAFLREELIKTNRLLMVPIQSVWSAVSAGDSISVSFNSQWISSIGIGGETTPYEMLIYETFSDFFTFDLVFGSNPSAFEAVTEILNIYIFIACFPRTAQRMIHQLGYRLTMLYNIMFPDLFAIFVSIYGDVRTNWGKDKFDSIGLQMTSVQSQQGYIYSIFTPTAIMKPSQIQDPSRNALKDLIVLISHLRTLAEPEVNQITLDRKRIAKYPYLYDDYTAHMSWKQIPFTTYNSDQRTSLGNKLQRIVKTAETFKRLLKAQHTSSAIIPPGFDAYYIQWSTQVSQLVTTCGSMFQITMAMMQKTLFNSPFFVGSRYNPDPTRFWYLPLSIGIGPLVSSSDSSSVIPQSILVPGFSINVGISMALCGVGEYSRNTISPLENNRSVEQLQTASRKDIMPLSGLDLFKMMNKITAHSRNYGYAMQLANWIISPEDPSNPFSSIASEIRYYMNMSNWVPLTRRIFEHFRVDFDDIFIHNVSSNTVIVDGRQLDRTLCLINPGTFSPIDEQPLNSKFGHKFQYIDIYDQNKIRILTRPLLDMDSRIIYVQNDWYLGCLIVNELGPTQLNLSQTNWVDETTYNSDFGFSRVTHKGGQVSLITYKSDLDKKEKTMILPYTSNSAPILLIKLDHVNQIPFMYVEPLAESVAQGKIILKIKNLRVRVYIEDMPLRTVDYSEPRMSTQEIVDILRSGAGNIIDRNFKSTQYATNFITNSDVRPAYTQWMATEKPADKNITMAALTNAIIQPSQTILPTAEEMGYGPDPEGREMVNENNVKVLKINSNIINWNNSIPTVSTKLLDTVTVELIPYVPGYMGPK